MMRNNRNNVRAAGFVRRLMMTGAVVGLVFAAGCARQTTRTFKEVDLGSPIPVEAEARPGSVTTPVSWTDKAVEGLPEYGTGQAIESAALVAPNGGVQAKWYRGLRAGYYVAFLGRERLEVLEADVPEPYWTRVPYAWAARAPHALTLANQPDVQNTKALAKSLTALANQRRLLADAADKDLPAIHKLNAEMRPQAQEFRGELDDVMRLYAQQTLQAANETPTLHAGAYLLALLRGMDLLPGRVGQDLLRESPLSHVFATPGLLTGATQVGYRRKGETGHIGYDIKHLGGRRVRIEAWHLTGQDPISPWFAK